MRPKLDFSISMSVSLPLGPAEESFRRYLFQILATDYSSRKSEPEEKIVGRAEAWYLPISICSPEDRFDCMDECSAGVANLEPLLFSKKGLTPAAVAAMGLDDYESDWVCDIIYIDSLQLDKEYRGLGIGLASLGLIPQLIAPDRTDLIVAGTAGPLNSRDLDDVEIGRIQVKLRRHWRQLGFRRLGKSEFIVLHTSRRLPDPLEFLKEVKI